MATSTKSPQQLASDRERLYEQVLQETQRQATLEAQRQRTSLNQQLQQQYTGMQQSRAQLQDANYQATQQIQNQLRSRGLASSGLASLAGVQQQQAYGANVNALEQQNAQVQQAAMLQRQSISDTLIGQQNAANIQYGQQVGASQEQLYQQQQQENQLIAELYLQARDSGDDQMLRDLMSLYGVDYEGLSTEQKEALDRESTTLLDNINISPSGAGQADALGWGVAGGGALSGALAGSMIGSAVPVVGTAIGGLVGLLAGWGAGEFAKGQDTKNSARTYNFNGKEYKVKADEMVNIVKEQFANRPYFNQMNISFDNVGRIKFGIGNNKFNTYSEAVNYIKTGKK